MITEQRVIFNKNGALTDISETVNRYNNDSAAFEYVAGQDYLYIGSSLPFSFRWFELSGANVNASDLTVEIWDNGWQVAGDVIDATSESSVSMSKSGQLKFRVSDNEGWTRDDTDDIPELTALKIKGFYWVRLSWSASFSVGTALKYCGFRFSVDDDFAPFYPQLTRTDQKAAWASGKTDWNDQHFAAAENIIRELRKLDIVFSANQLHDPEQLNEAAVHKAAEIIFNGFGDDYQDQRQIAREYYKEAKNIGVWRVDTDGDGRVDDRERFNYGTMRRV